MRNFYEHFSENTQNLQNILDELVRDEEQHQDGDAGEGNDRNNDEAAASSNESDDESYIVDMESMSNLSESDSSEVNTDDSS